MNWLTEADCLKINLLGKLKLLQLFTQPRCVTRGGRGGGLPCPFSKIGKRCPNLEKNDFSYKF